MTFNELLEMNLEIGNGKAYVLGNQQVTHKTIDKSGEHDETKQKLLDANKVLSKPSKEVINKILLFLKSKKMYNKISKLDLQSADIVMKADGGATINFDGGGSISIPASALRNFNY